ncbi:MAG: cell division protein SepF [Firmicutes bacterium HGW-Firmicutes-13]|nr:MAG: cell division protein SepF [Firmicutes bacterium HGW-Firmicutes-13]
MSLKFIEKVLVFLGLAEEEDDDKEMVSRREPHPQFSRRGKVVSLHTGKNLKVIVTEPKHFDDAQTIAENLKNKSPVVINLEQADLETAKRIIDFVSGATFAINGNYQKISSQIFIFSPPNIDINAAISKSEVNAYTSGVNDDSETEE